MKPPVALRSIFAGAAVLFIALTVLFSTNFDFHAFYCSGYAIRAHADPYRTQPLATCERTKTDSTFKAFFGQLALPAPQPGYDAALFAVFAMLPFAAASKLWTALLLACSLAAILLVRRISGEPLAVVSAALWLSLCMTSIYLGEIVPVCVCAIAAAAWFAKTSRYALAGLCAAATLVQPHIGIPVCLSVALWLPRARLALASAAGALAALAIATIGVQGNIEYAFAVLPAHALSEIGSDAQLGIAAVLHAVGMPAAGAVRAASVLFAAFAGTGLLLAGTLARRFRDDAFVVAVPAAIAVTFGVFMHVTEVAAALPLALLLRSHGAANRSLLTGAIVLLAVPWWSLATPMLFGSATGTLLAAVTVFFLVYNLQEQRAATAACIALAAAGALTLLLRWHDASAVHGAFAHVPQALLRAPYPEASWRWFNDAYMSTGSAPSWGLRAASWIGLGLTGAAAIRPVRKALAA